MACTMSWWSSHAGWPTLHVCHGLFGGLVLAEVARGIILLAGWAAQAIYRRSSIAKGNHLASCY
jgi:hypothetical protein